MARYTSSTAAVRNRRAVANGSTLRSKSKTPDTTTGNGAEAFTYKDKAALFLLAVTNFTGQKGFYESADDRDERFLSLLTKVTKKDHEWVAKMLTWLRSEGNIRTASIIGAVEYGRIVSGNEKIDAEGEFTPRAVLASVLQRADEPSEALGYWISRYGNKKLPAWFRRGLGDGAKKLYNGKSVFKYDSKAAKVRFGDVVSLSSVKTDGYKSDVFRFVLDRRYGNEKADGYGELGDFLVTRRVIESVPAEKRSEWLAKADPKLVEEAGYNWEALAGWLGGALTADFWEKLIPSMGYMALIRNLRNFAKAEISDQAARLVAKRIADPEEVAKSRQLPLRFLSAYRVMEPAQQYRGWGWGYESNVFSDVGTKYKKLWVPALSKALNQSLLSVPELDGQTVIMIDTSASMNQTISDKSTVSYYENAVAFGVALALRNPDAVVYGYSDSAVQFHPIYTASLLENIEKFKNTKPCAGGTATWTTAHQLLKRNKGTDRLIIVTDEQANGGYHWGDSKTWKDVPEDVTTVTYNLAGYEQGQAPSGRDNFHTVAGLTDAGFQLLSQIDSAASGSWPWES